MTTSPPPNHEFVNPSPTIRASVTSLGSVLSSFGGDDDDVDAYMNAIADELDAKIDTLQAQSWSHARLQQESYRPWHSIPQATRTPFAPFICCWLQTGSNNRKR